MTTSPGWYPDPQGLPQLRWWDGIQWTSAVQPFTPESGQQPASLPPSSPPESSQQRITLFNGKKRAQKLQAEVDRLRVLIDRMGIGGVDALDAETARLNEQVAALRVEYADLNAQIAAARIELVETQGQQELQTVGLYRYHHPAETSGQFKDELARVQAAIKQAVRDKTAITATSNFTFNNSVAQGRKFVADMWLSPRATVTTGRAA